jgi:hypothetical protein
LWGRGGVKVHVSGINRLKVEETEQEYEQSTQLMTTDQVSEKALFYSNS